MCRLIRYYNCLGNCTIPVRVTPKLFNLAPKYEVVFVYKDENYQEVDSFYIQHDDISLSYEEYMKLIDSKKE